jgi:hypothetical protein
VTGRLADASQPPAEPAHLPPASGQRFARMVQLAARHGITALAFAPPGRLRGHVAGNRDLSGVLEFQRAAADLLGAEVTVYCDPTGRWATSTSAPAPSPPRPCQRRPPGPSRAARTRGLARHDRGPAR